jgi:hypothetical protein
MTPLHLEIIYRGHQCPSCFYMAEAVEAVRHSYGDAIRVTLVEFMRSRIHACRLYDLSVSLYGEEAVRKKNKVAPIPSLFINGELVFDKIPPQYELINAIDFNLLAAGKDFNSFS